MQTGRKLLVPSGDDEPHKRRLTMEIQKVELNIDNVRKMTKEAINTLEERKRKLRKDNDPNAAYAKETEEIDRQIQEIAGQSDLILKELTPVHAEVVERRLSIDQLDLTIANMDREISRIQAEHDQALIELEQKKNSLRQRLSSIEKLDLLINVLTYKIFETQHDYRKDMDEMLRQREELLRNTNLTQSQLALALAELERKMADRKNMHESSMMSLKGQRGELQRESALKTQHMDSTMEALKRQHEAMLAELEAQKANASPEEIEEINRRISELNKMLEKDIANLRRLQGQGWKDLLEEEKLSGILEARGLRATPSGQFLTGSGRLLTRSQASCLGLLEGLEAASWNSIIHGRRQLGEASTSDSTLSQESSSTAASEDSKMSSEDVYYLKTILGKPLTLALAEITGKQPRDPIHYLGHWLFKYRYNQEVDIIKKQEIQELIDEREQIEKEKLHVLLEDEARAAVLNMVIRAEEEAIREELERIAREAAMLEAEDEELEAEARDVLGIYDGPVAGQRIGST